MNNCCYKSFHLQFMFQTLRLQEMFRFQRPNQTAWVNSCRAAFIVTVFHVFRVETHNERFLSAHAGRVALSSPPSGNKTRLMSTLDEHLQYELKVSF